jgi:hypothetical protein
MAVMASPDCSQSLMASLCAEVTITKGPYPGEGASANSATKNCPVWCGGRRYADTGRKAADLATALVQLKVGRAQIDNDVVGVCGQADVIRGHPGDGLIGALGQADLQPAGSLVDHRQYRRGLPPLAWHLMGGGTTGRLAARSTLWSDGGNQSQGRNVCVAGWSVGVRLRSCGGGWGGAGQGLATCSIRSWPAVSRPSPHK